jgi:integrase
MLDPATVLTLRSNIMRAPKVSIHLRVSQPDGRRPYLKPVYANRRLKPHYAWVDKKPEHFPSGVYYLRYTIPGQKPTWEMIGSDAELIPDIHRARKHDLEGAAMGKPVALVRPLAARPLVESITRSPLGKQSLDEAINKYLAEKKEHRRRKTYLAYALALRLFREVCVTRQKVMLHQIDREDLLGFITSLRDKRGNVPRTLHNKVVNVQTFLHHFGFPSLLTKKKGDLPKYTKKKVTKYGDSVLDRMFDHATLDESDLLNFFMDTGAREQETANACWSDVDLDGKTYTIREHLDLGFMPKDSEEGTIRISDSLVEILRARRKRYPTGRLIFPGPNGKPHGHLLRVVKALGLRAGVNCGFCINKKGQSCATHPVCREVILHKLRKTYASKLSRKGVPPRTIQRWLRHSDLATTLGYLADEDDEGLAEMVNQAFPTRAPQTRI